ncbi:hypothetical protein KPH14_000906 [Odynerus spinipes]|uniref:DUF7041 domain-containing protein n=1 Tax=Odynerus spinipes TaxID=1348599 RepID=A0AAD9RD77_9HYME|nr:hypothetical protein KPH14_000906 [Odynerus spinipes]
MTLEHSPKSKISSETTSGPPTSSGIPVGQGVSDFLSINNEPTEVVAALRDMRLLPFIRTRPDVWFNILESRFRTYRVTSDLKKYDLALGQLDVDTLHQLTDIICREPQEGKYEHLKQTLIDRLSDSRVKQLHTLLTDLQLADRKPSELLRQMRDLAGETVSDEFLHSLWINRMPSSVRGILSVADTSNLNNLAALADEVLDYTTSSCMMTTSSSAVGESPLTLSSLSNLEHRLQNVEKQPYSRVPKFNLSPACELGLQHWWQRVGSLCRRFANPWQLSPEEAKTKEKDGAPDTETEDADPGGSQDFTDSERDSQRRKIPATAVRYLCTERDSSVSDRGASGSHSPISDRVEVRREYPLEEIDFSLLETRNSEMSAQLDFQAAIKCVKSFDGSSTDKLLDFLASCEFTFSITKEADKPALFAYIRNVKLEGKAAHEMRYKELNTFEDL